MNQNILIDLTKCRDCESCTADCMYTFHPGNKGVMSILEMAVFAVSCRRCKDAPCVEVCPADALDKNDENMVVRWVNLCVACKSCVAICPFGTIMNDLFEPRKSICDYCELNGEINELLCVESCPENALKITDMEEDPENNLFRVHEKVLVKDYKWEKLAKL